MKHITPLSPRPLRRRPPTGGHNAGQVLTLRQLRAHGVTAADLAERTGPSGAWQRLLPGVYLLHRGTPTTEERLRGALLYAAGQEERSGPAGGAMVTGLAALALHGFCSAPPPSSLDRIDVLVPLDSPVRSAGQARIVRDHELPEPAQISGVPVAPVPRALADSAARLTDAADVRALLTEAVRAGHCGRAAVVAELGSAGLLSLPHVADAMSALLTGGRAAAEGRLYEMVDRYALPDPLWNVTLWLSDAPCPWNADAYWPDHRVALVLDTRTSARSGTAGGAEGAVWHTPQAAPGRRRVGDRPSGLDRGQHGITVVRVTPWALREAMEWQAALVRAALAGAGRLGPAASVAVLPR